MKYALRRSALVALLCSVVVSAGCTSKEEPSSVKASSSTPTPVTADTIKAAEKAAGDTAKKSDKAATDASKKADSTLDDMTSGIEDALSKTKSKTLRFSGIPNQNSTELNEKYKPLATYLTQKLGITVEYVPLVDYNATVDAFKNGDLQMCWFGGYTGVQARAAVTGARAIACGPQDMHFKSYFVANKSLGLQKSADFPMALKGKKWTFGPDKSTSARLMPEAFIRKFTKMSPKEFFGTEPAFSKSHDMTCELIAAGTFECGPVDYTVYDRRVAEKKTDPEVVQIIWVTPEYCDYQFTVHPTIEATFGKGFTEKLQNVLTSIKGDDLKVLKALLRDDKGLIPCKNEDFETLRQTAIDIGLLR